jgi:coenzyme PQQ precursor peptide PqqA
MRLGLPVSFRHMLSELKIWARTLKRDVHAIYLAARSPRVPWHAKIIAMAVAGYALSPIDLIPDFIPVLGYVDDLLIVPSGIWLVLSMIPKGSAGGVPRRGGQGRNAAAQQRRCNRHGSYLDPWDGDARLDRLCPLGTINPGRPSCCAVAHRRWSNGVRGSPLALIWGGSYRCVGTAVSRTVERISEMAWKTPKIVEVPVGMEINMYACAARK